MSYIASVVHQNLEQNLVIFIVNAFSMPAIYPFALCIVTFAL